MEGEREKGVVSKAWVWKGAGILAYRLGQRCIDRPRAPKIRETWIGAT